MAKLEYLIAKEIKHSTAAKKAKAEDKAIPKKNRNSSFNKKGSND